MTGHGISEPLDYKISSGDPQTPIVPHNISARKSAPPQIKILTYGKGMSSIVYLVEFPCSAETKCFITIYLPFLYVIDAAESNSQDHQQDNDDYHNRNCMEGNRMMSK